MALVCSFLVLYLCAGSGPDVAMVRDPYANASSGDKTIGDDMSLFVAIVRLPRGKLMQYSYVVTGD